MNKHSLFLSIVCVLQNKESECKEIINNISKVITNLTDDYEIIVVDNSSKDKTTKILEELTCGNDAVKNLQVFSLTNEVDKNIANWAGVESVYEISGEADLVAVVHVDDTVGLRELLDRMWLAAPAEIASTTTELVLEQY
mgnify:CR=1 FL=1